MTIKDIANLVPEPIASTSKIGTNKKVKAVGKMGYLHMVKFPCKYKYCNEAFSRKASLYKHYINVHPEKLLTTTIEKFKNYLDRVEKRNIDNKGNPPNNENKSGKKFKNPYPRIHSVPMRN